MNNEEMKHCKNILTINQCIIMITTLEKYAELFKGLPPTEINMDMGGIPTCKTPGCFGGWVAFFNGEKVKHSRHSYYEKGADIFAKEMGFEKRWDLENFFESHPEIWGNRRGWYLFHNDSAYSEGDKEYVDGYPGGTLTVEGIINKLLGVAERLKKILEDQK